MSVYQVVYNHRNQRVGNLMLLDMKDGEQLLRINFEISGYGTSRTFTFEEYESYKNDMDFKHEDELGQLSIDDLL